MVSSGAYGPVWPVLKAWLPSLTFRASLSHNWQPYIELRELKSHRPLYEDENPQYFLLRSLPAEQRPQQKAESPMEHVVTGSDKLQLG